MKKSEIFNIELTLQIKRGSQGAFEILFKMYYESLVNYALVFVKNREAASEIVQETFIKIWEIKESLNEQLSIKAFIYRCVHNNCINFLKKHKTDKQFNEAYQNDCIYSAKLLENDDEQDFFDYVDDNHIEEKIREAIDSLPSQCREIFIAVRFNEMSYAEIATKLNISINTVKTQLQRAMSKIREAMV